VVIDSLNAELKAKYLVIYELETLCDPSGLVQEVVALRENQKGLVVKLDAKDLVIADQKLIIDGLQAANKLWSDKYGSKS
jgi:hypothetical protein